MRRSDFAFPVGSAPPQQAPAISAIGREEKRGAMDPQPEFQNARREQFTILTPLEKKALAWLAHRMPVWVNSDHLTALGFVAMLFAGMSFWLARWNHLGFLLFIFWLGVNWFGDSLDGTLARVRNQQRPKYGFYVDHMVDTFGALFLLGGMMLSGAMSPAIAAGLLIAYFMLAIEIYLATYSLGTFHLSFWKMGPTELRVILAIGSLALYHGSSVTIAGEHYCLFDVGGGVGIAGLLVTVIVAALRHTRLLYRAEPLKAAGRVAGPKHFIK
jgi:phosphatidylglycerophosphate synthase